MSCPSIATSLSDLRRLVGHAAGRLALLALSLAAAPALAALPAERLKVPAGFTIELLTDAVPSARAMALGRSSEGRAIVYVGSMSAGKVYAVEIDHGRAARVHTIASGLQLPAGVAWRDGSLYVSAVSRIVRFDGIDDRLGNPPAPRTVTDRLASETHHGAKFIGFGPDGLLYAATGAPCNVCEPDQAHGVLQRMQTDGSGLQTVASGLRNSVGFDWSPLDDALWMTDNGRDMLGDDLPADELNRLQQPGQHFGFPYCHQGDLPDPQFGARRSCSDFVPPAAKLGAHVAALGMRFYRGSAFPPEFRNNVFIAERGSWNRSRKSGYQVVRAVPAADGRSARVEPFITGWLEPEARDLVHGRPTDVLPLPDGSLLVSDEFGGALYRVRWGR